MTDTKGTINARKLGNTGITEDLLQKIADAHGGHLVIIAELKAKTIAEDGDGSGDRHVSFIIDTAEAVVDGKLNGALVDHVREIQAALHRNRKLAENGPQLPIDGDDVEPTMAKVMTARDALIEHDDEGPKLWDGQSQPDDDPDDEPDRPNPAWEPHTYVDTSYGTCGYPDCGAAAGDKVHTDATVTGIGKSPFVTI